MTVDSNTTNNRLYSIHSHMTKAIGYLLTQGFATELTLSLYNFHVTFSRTFKESGRDELRRLVEICDALVLAEQQSVSNEGIR